MFTGCFPQSLEEAILTDCAQELTLVITDVLLTLTLSVIVMRCNRMKETDFIVQQTHSFVDAAAEHE